MNLRKVLLAPGFAALCAAQAPAPEKMPTPPPATVYSNPRAGADDPRVGLKGGLYDAGEAAFGMQRIVSLPKPPGFAPGEASTAPAPEAPPETPGAAGGGRAGRGMGLQYGSTNSDLAF